MVTGQELVLHCTVEGNPQPSITWLRKGRVLPSFEPSHRLVLSDVQEEDSGDYTCLASNSVGSTEKQFDVKVIGRCCEFCPILLWISKRVRSGPCSAQIPHTRVNQHIHSSIPSAGKLLIYPSVYISSYPLLEILQEESTKMPFKLKLTSLQAPQSAFSFVGAAFSELFCLCLF